MVQGEDPSFRFGVRSARAASAKKEKSSRETSGLAGSEFFGSPQSSSGQILPSLGGSPGISNVQLEKAEIIFQERSKYDGGVFLVTVFNLQEEKQILLRLKDSETSSAFKELVIDWKDLIEYAKSAGKTDLLVNKKGLNKLFKDITSWLTVTDGNLRISNISLDQNVRETSLE